MHPVLPASSASPRGRVRRTAAVNPARRGLCALRIEPLDDSCGVAAGAVSPNQVSTSEPLMPSSASVGTSGRPGARLAMSPPMPAACPPSTGGSPPRCPGTRAATGRRRRRQSPAPRRDRRRGHADVGGEQEKPAAMCGVVPMRPEPKLMAPGSALAISTSSPPTWRRRRDRPPAPTARPRAENACDVAGHRTRPTCRAAARRRRSSAPRPSVSCRRLALWPDVGRDEAAGAGLVVDQHLPAEPSPIFCATGARSRRCRRRPRSPRGCGWGGTGGRRCADTGGARPMPAAMVVARASDNAEYADHVFLSDRWLRTV